MYKPYDNQGGGDMPWGPKGPRKGMAWMRGQRHYGPALCVQVPKENKPLKPRSGSGVSCSTNVAANRATLPNAARW